MLVLILIITLATSSFAYEPVDLVEIEQEANSEAKKEVNSITIVMPYIPWEMPWTNGDVPSIGEQMIIPPSQYNPELLVSVDEYFIYASHDGNSKLITLEIEVVESLAEMPMKPGETTVVTDGFLIYIIRDELQTTGESVNAERYIEIYDRTKPLIWYGTISIHATGFYDGGNVNIEAGKWGAFVSSSRNALNLSITSTSLSPNPSAVVRIDAEFSLLDDYGTSRTGTVYMYIYTDDGYSE